MEGRTEDSRDLTPQEKGLLQMSAYHVEKDEIAAAQKVPLEFFESFVDNQLKRIEEVDLKSYTNWDDDPDCNYSIQV